MQNYLLDTDTEQFVYEHLPHAFPNALSIYAFGSRIQGTANAQSDLDLAVLVAGYADPLQLFEMANQLADKLGYEVDLLDLRCIHSDAISSHHHWPLLMGKRCAGRFI